MDSKQDSIQVFIRVKPGDLDQTLSFTDTQVKLDRHQFAFDRIFPPQSTQDEIFDAVGHRLLSNTLDGYHGCVFVYGQTGSGKTHTMIGEDNGLMQKSFRQLFVRINSLENAQCFVTCSYFELYNEQILDLLDPKKEKKLMIRQDTKKGIFVQNLLQQTAFTSNKLYQTLQLGMKNRHVGQTMMNRQSSRSHSVFTISLSCKLDNQGKKVLKSPKLHFVDLAGSQRQKLTSATGDRLKEAGNINRSLTTLGMVINALTSDKPRTHIPYRDSKLTTLLRDSLGGNSKTFIIATVASSVMCFQETLSTLNFANRAKMVKVRALINEESLSTNIQTYKEQIRRLKAEVAKLKSERKSGDRRQILSPDPQAIMDTHFQQINCKISSIADQLTRNTVSPAFENIIQKLQEARMDKKEITEMVGEDEEQQQADALMDYLNSNYELLSQVNQKVSEYLHMKHELRMTAISGKMSVEPIRSPSKEERVQYDQILAKKDAHNQQMHGQVLSLRDQITDRELKILQLQQTVKGIENSQKGESELVTSYRQSLYTRQKQLIAFKSKLVQLEQDCKRSESTVQQYESTIKEVRDLYHFSEQKLQSEIYMKNKLQSQFKVASTKVQSLETQIKNIKQKYNVEMQEMKSTVQSLQSSEEELKRQIQVLEQTVQFHQKKANEYSEKNKNLEVNNQKMKKNIQSLALQKTQIQQRITQLQFKISSTQQIITQLESSNQRDMEKLKLSENSRRQLLANFEHYRKHSDEEILNLKREKQTLVQSVLRLNQQMCCYQATIQENDRKIYNSQQKLVQLGQIREKEEIELKKKIEQHLAIQEDILQGKNQLENTVVELNRQVESQMEQIQVRGMQLKQLAQAFEATRVIRQQNEQLRKSYQAVVKQNYRLKAMKDGKYENSEQLFSKVQYYEEKFKLMSMEYKKATQSVKRLKQRELQQSKVIHNLQEHVKNMKFSRNTLQLEEIIKTLEEQNNELRRKGVKKTPSQKQVQSSESSSQLSKAHQQEEFIHKRVTEFINKWGNREASPQNMTFEDLVSSWEKIQLESRRKLESVAQGIHRQQKLKSQNNFILKENIYLKQKLNSIEKELELSSSKPRKQLKGNETGICSEERVF